MTIFGFISWSFAILLAFLVKQSAIACTLSTPSITDGIVNDQAFQVSVTHCTPPYLIQFWDRNSSTMLTFYNGTATVVDFTIKNGVDVDVYFVLKDGAGLRLQSIDYIVQSNPNEAIISQASTSSMATIESIRSLSILSSVSVTSLQVLSSLSVQSVLSIQSGPSLSPTTSTTEFSTTTSSPFPSETLSGSRTTSTGAGPTNPSSKGNRGSSANVGAIVGGIVGGILGTAILVLLVAWFQRRKKYESPLDYPPQPPDPPTGSPRVQTGQLPVSGDSGYPVQVPFAGSFYSDPRNYYEGGTSNRFDYGTNASTASVGRGIYNPRGEASPYRGSNQYGPVSIPGSSEELVGPTNFSVSMTIERPAHTPPMQEGSRYSSLPQP